MADPSNAIHTLLTAHAGVSASVGTKVTPNRGSQGKDLPYITFSRIASQHIENLGASHGLNRAVYQIDCWAKKHDTARALAEHVRDALQGFSGTSASVVVDWISLQDDRDRYDPPTDASEDGTHSVSMDFDVWHTETIPTFP